MFHFLLLLPLAAASQQSQAPAELLEPPRLGLVFKGGASAAKARLSRLTDHLSTLAVPVEIVPLDALPASAAKAKAPVPRWVFVLEEAKAVATGARTEEYEEKGGIGKTSRIRFRGAVAEARGKLYEFRDKPVQVAVVEDVHDESGMPKAGLFGPDELKKEIVIDPDLALDRIVQCIVGRELSLAVGIDLWRMRAEIPALGATLTPDQSAAFWARAAAVALDPLAGRTPVPWRSLDVAAVALWKGAPAEAHRRAHRDEQCAWCPLPVPEGADECPCPESSALASARQVLLQTMQRAESSKLRDAARALEVPIADLHSSRAGKWKKAVIALSARIEAEHEADRRILAAHLGGKERPQRTQPWYVALAVRETVAWEPSDPDLLRHAAALVHGFGLNAYDAAPFGLEIARPTIALVEHAGNTVYRPVEKREKPGDPETIERFLVQALWGNARGQPKAP